MSLGKPRDDSKSVHKTPSDFRGSPVDACQHRKLASTLLLAKYLGAILEKFPGENPEMIINVFHECTGAPLLNSLGTVNLKPFLEMKSAAFAGLGVSKVVLTDEEKKSLSSTHADPMGYTYVIGKGFEAKKELATPPKQQDSSPPPALPREALSLLNKTPSEWRAKPSLVKLAKGLFLKLAEQRLKGDRSPSDLDAVLKDPAWDWLCQSYEGLTNTGRQSGGFSERYERLCALRASNITAVAMISDPNLPLEERVRKLIRFFLNAAEMIPIRSSLKSKFPIGVPATIDLSEAVLPLDLELLEEIEEEWPRLGFPMNRNVKEDILIAPENLSDEQVSLLLSHKDLGPRLIKTLAEAGDLSKPVLGSETN